MISRPSLWGRSAARCLLGAVVGLALLGPAALHAQSRLRKSLADDQVAAHWIYDDLPKAVKEARASGKPILALLRCVP